MPASDKNSGNAWESSASIRQLELELAIVLEEAREDLYAADVVGIFEGIRAGLAELPDGEQLRLAGTALLQLQRSASCGPIGSVRTGRKNIIKQGRC